MIWYLLFSMLFGTGSLDVFYIDKIEQGVNKEVEDKERKKKIKVTLKEYSNTAKKFDKCRKKQIEELKKKNLNKTTSKDWYRDFFAIRLEERKELQELFIDQRMMLQNNIMEEEWQKIMQRASEATVKLEEKEKKKENKQHTKDHFDRIENAINELFIEDKKLTENMQALRDFEKEYYNMDNAYDDINVNESHFLADKNARRADLHQLGESLNNERARMYQAYTRFLMTLKENTDSEEWEFIIKKFNKSI